LVGVLVTRRTVQEMLASAMGTLFPVLFVGLSLGFLVGLRAAPGEDGEDLLMLLFLCVILADTAAYYVGTSIGKRRLAPAISPNKSWEGAIGGIVASVLGALVAHAWFYQRLPVGHALALGLILGLTAILGDLAESMVKRASGVKDSSSLLPGHGGVLDRVDSLLFAGPVLYYYHQWFLAGAA
jgi:phosphatidate cytidylyltransferase